MASIILAGGFYVTQKVRDKKAAKKEAKRKAYEDRYKELEEDHKKTSSIHRELTNSGTDAGRASGDVGAGFGAKAEMDSRRRSSEDSKPGDSEGEDGPTRWVQEASLQRKRTMSSSGG